MINRKSAAAWIMAGVMAVSAAPWAMAENAVADNNGQVDVVEDNIAAEAADQNDEQGALIEDSGEDVQNTDGRDFEEVKKEEEEQEKAKEELEEILGAQTLKLSPANSENLEEYLEELEAMPNLTGSQEELEVALYIEKKMTSWNYIISEQSFHEGEANEDGIDVPGINIIAERGASTEEHTDGIVVVTCHYDAASLSVNDKSGAAVVLETARILSTVDTDVDLCFVFLSGEEDGWYGSKAFAESIKDAEKDRIRAVISLEDVGEGPDLYLGTADGNANEPGNYLAAAAALRALESADAMEGADQATAGAADTDAADTGAADTGAAGKDAAGAVQATATAGEVSAEVSGETLVEDETEETELPWSYILRENGPLAQFAEQGMTAVTVFREIPQETDLLIEEEMLSEEMSDVPAEDVTEVNAAEENSRDDAAPVVDAAEAISEAADEAETETKEPAAGEKLAQVTDILTTALAAYMQPARAELNK